MFEIRFEENDYFLPKVIEKKYRTDLEFSEFITLIFCADSISVKDKQKIFNKLDMIDMKNIEKLNKFLVSTRERFSDFTKEDIKRLNIHIKPFMKLN